MRAFTLHGDEPALGLADVTAELEDAVGGLGFARRGALFVRTFAGDATHAAAAGARFEIVAESMVRQAARLEPIPWEDALATLVERVGTGGWWLVGSAALAVRGLDVAPSDIDLGAETVDCERIADALADLLVEPLSDGGYLGERWFRAFAGARLECVGGVHAAHDEPKPCDFGRFAVERLETVRWRGLELRVPPLDLQLACRRRRGL